MRTTSFLRSGRAIKKAIFLPGQGVQRPGMVSKMMKQYPRIVGEMVGEIDALMGDAFSDRYLLDLNTPGSELAQTEFAQPAILATSLIIMRILEKEYGVDVNRIDYIMGHSLGEFTALALAGVIEPWTAVWLVRQRGKAMQLAADQWGGKLGMYAVVMEKERFTDVLEQLESFCAATRGTRNVAQVANINSSTQVVLSGSEAAIQSVLQSLRRWSGHDPRAVRLNVSAPFHSEIMMPARRHLADILGLEDQESAAFPLDPPLPIDRQVLLRWPPPVHTKVIANMTALPFEHLNQVRYALAASSTEPVDWKGSLDYLVQHGVTRFCAIGPGRVGRQLAGKEFADRPELQVIGASMSVEFAGAASFLS
ncbi:hypothetical protein CANCADRAFT_144321 [Tortispora caseinolytica NRRL Y-17796]|uniref:[acyl-carrier-protein] S-malonyltransferase n=1 Tax=Tortispora caseinolytica NRRL Y-17796 TaxID=767744 RepID=A0A1E4TDG3_9ASCO|nr:hypothetical protein CANCADRAFT_144321 [Tortispora caseinolytica NRRL Y-17796]